MIKPGEIAYLKATDEKVFVLRVDGPADKHEFEQLSGKTAYVRKHVIEDRQSTWTLERYAIEELETREENTTRRIAWEVEITKRVREALGPRGEEAPQGKGFLN